MALARIACGYDVSHLSREFCSGIHDAGRYVIVMRLPRSRTIEKRWADTLESAERILQEMRQEGRNAWGRNDPHAYRIRDLSKAK